MAGSIEKRGKNSYRLVCLAGYDLQGRPIKKTKTIHGTKKDAEIELAKFVADVQNGLVIEGKSLKFSEFTEIWKRDYGSKELAPSTYKRYCRMLETRLLPYFGHFYINKIKPTDIMKFYDLLEKAVEASKKHNARYHVGNIMSSDIFYGADSEAWKKWQSMGVLGVEMESYALYCNAAYLHKKALTILTVSDSFTSHKETTAEESKQLIQDFQASHTFRPCHTLLT